MISDNYSQLTNAEFSLLFLMIPNHRNVCINNSLPDYVWLVHLFWTLPQRQFSSIYSCGRVRGWEAGCSCVKEAVAGIPSKSVPGRKPVLSLHMSAHGSLFSKEVPSEGVALGSDSLPTRILECTGQTGHPVTPLRKGLLPPAVSCFRVCLSCRKPFTSGAAALQCLTRERICCLWLDLNLSGRPGLLTMKRRAWQGASGSFKVLGLTLCSKWPLSPWGLGKCWVLSCKTYSSSHSRYCWCYIPSGLISAPLWPLQQVPQELVQSRQECVGQPSFRGAGVGPWLSLLAHRTVNWEGPSRTSPWCLLLSSRCFWGSLPRYTAVTLILISGSVFGGAQTQPQWVSSYSMGTKLDALDNWLDAGHGHPFCLAVGCEHPFWMAIAGIRALCLVCWVSYHLCPVERPHITRKLLVLPHFTEGETEVQNIAWGHRAKKLSLLLKFHLLIFFNLLAALFVGSYSQTRNWKWVPCNGSMEF